MSSRTYPGAPPPGLLATAAMSLALYRVARSLGNVVRAPRMTRLAGAVAGAYAAYSAYRALAAGASAREAVCAAARRNDEALDARLDSSFPASDAVASY